MNIYCANKINKIFIVNSNTIFNQYLILEFTFSKQSSSTVYSLPPKTLTNTFVVPSEVVFLVYCTGENPSLWTNQYASESGEFNSGGESYSDSNFEI